MQLLMTLQNPPKPSYVDISEALHCTERTVERIVEEAKRRLESMLGLDGPEKES